MSNSLRDLYPKGLNVGAIWNKFHFLHPDFLPFNHPDYLLNSYLFPNQVKNTFFSPSTPIAEVEQEFYHAMNRGIHALNTLVEQHLPDLSDMLCIKEVDSPPDLSTFIAQTKQLVTQTDHTHDAYQKMIAYKKMQALELAYQVLMIDMDSDVQASLFHYPVLWSGFSALLGITNKEKTAREDFPYAWPTSANVSLYGTEEKPFRSRVKYLDEQGHVKYSSILVKLLRKKMFVNSLHDNAGVELIVSTEEQRQNLVRYFRESKVIPKLADFEERQPGTPSTNTTSSPDYAYTKFSFRLPVPLAYIPNHPLEHNIHQRVPTEVQTLTIEDHNRREQSATARHQEYKHRQFMDVFPALFQIGRA